MEFSSQPAAKLDRQWDAHRGANGAKNFAEQREIPKQAGTAALDHFFGGAAEIDVHSVVAEVLNQSRSGPPGQNSP